jgi:hypothetical protein
MHKNDEAQSEFTIVQALPGPDSLISFNGLYFVSFLFFFEE